MNELVLHIKDGITNKTAVRKFFEGLKDGKYLLTAKSIKRRSNNQNAYLHGVVIPLVYEGLKSAGFDDVRDHEDAKMIIKDLFLRRTIRNEKTNTSIQVIRKTSELTTVEMMDFIAEVQKWASEYLNTYIPDPNQQSVMFAHFDNDLETTIVER